MMKQSPQQILLIDDRRENLLALEHVLADPGRSILTATSGNEALSLLLDHPVALILMDVQMPEMDGFETAELIRGNPDTCRIPIIFVTAINTDTQHIFKGYDAGAVDYLSKPLDPETLVRKVKVFLELHRYQQSLVATTRELTEMVTTLKETNARVQAQQKKILREERLKVLLQMAGAMAHELSQPLMALQGNLQLMQMHKENPDKLTLYMDRIDNSGRRITEIIQKIQTLHVDDTREYAGDASIINLDQTIRILVVGEDGREGAPLKRALGTLDRLDIVCAEDARSAESALASCPRDLLFITHPLPEGSGDALALNLPPQAKRPPFIVVTDTHDELTTSRLIRKGAFDVLERHRITPDLVRNLIHRALDTVVSSTALAAMDRAAEDALCDSRTGLYTRASFESRLHRMVPRARRMEQGLALLFMRLENVDEVVGTYGAKAGDMVLASIGSLLSDMTRPGDLAARFGHTTFAVLLSDIAASEVPRIARRFTDAITQKEYVYNAFRFNLTLGTGTGILSPGTAGSAEGLLREAREACFASTGGTSGSAPERTPALTGIS